MAALSRNNCCYGKTTMNFIFNVVGLQEAIVAVDHVKSLRVVVETHKRVLCKSLVHKISQKYVP